MTCFGRKAVVGDLNRDGRDDLIIADHGFDPSRFPGATNGVGLSQPGGKLRDIGPRFESEPEFTRSDATGDVDGNGPMDIFRGNFGNDDAYIPTVPPNGAVTREGVRLPGTVDRFT